MNMSYLIIALIVLAGVINFLPLVVVLSSGRLEAAYGIGVDDPTLELLLRHRAVLFGLIGGLMIFGAFQQSWHWPVIFIGIISMAGFISLSWQVGDYAAEIKKILIADWIDLGALALASALKIFYRASPPV